MTELRRVLVTGASGLLGAEVVAQLTRGGHRVTGLVHRVGCVVRNDGQPVPEADGRLRLVRGDVTLPRFGLSGRGWAELVATADLIVHCAAVTDFGRPDEVYQRVNFDGTRHVLDLARQRGVPLVHVGTAYVCGERSGRIAEDELDVGQRMGNAYEASKLRAETAVREAAADGLGVVVVRPSIVVGAARTGVVRDFKNIYVVLKLTTQGQVRSIPGNFDATLDLVAVDHVAEVITESVIRFAEARGRTFHVTGGGLSLRDFSDVLAEFPSFHVPRFVSPSAFDPARLPATERAYHAKVITRYESYFRRKMAFDRTATDEFLRRPASPGGKPLLRKVLNYALRTGYLEPRLPGVDQVLAELDAGAA